jgi:hypothetical protein
MILKKLINMKEQYKIGYMKIINEFEKFLKY